MRNQRRLTRSRWEIRCVPAVRVTRMAAKLLPKKLLPVHSGMSRAPSMPSTQRTIPSRWQDAISKSAVVVKMSPDSQMKRLPPEMAQRIAMRLKGAAGDGEQSGVNGQSASGQSPLPPGASATRTGEESQAERGPGGSPAGNGAPDLQRLLSRLPNGTLADLQKGDAVMLVSAEGGSSNTVTAITMLAGVEAILTAAPNRSASSLLSPWTLGAPGGGEGEASQ